VPPPSFDPRATAPSPPSFAPRAAPTEPAGDERLLREFLAGARIATASIAEGLTPELMRRIGAMLAVAVQGTIELIATRALLKREVKADVTIISTTRNNPLKFLPDAESALLQMFGTRIPGFMAPVEAMEDAFRDLRAHEVGVIAGMHAALAQVLKRFAPDELEKRLKPPGVLEGLLPNSHEARLWQAFAEMYVDISREAQDDFQSLFGKAFLQAYENEVSRLKGK
jgi:FHA domain-containing protein